MLAAPADDDLVARFEACTLPPWAFGHREHLLVAFVYLRTSTFEDAATRFVRNVKRFAARHGAEGKYHATVTWALLSLLAEAIDDLRPRRPACGGSADANPSLSFEALLAARPDLLAARETLTALYGRGVLESDRARRVPLLPRHSLRE